MFHRVIRGAKDAPEPALAFAMCFVPKGRAKMLEPYADRKSVV